MGQSLGAPEMSVPTHRPKGRRPHAPFAVAGMASIGLVTVLLVATPLASGAVLGVTITKPYTGNQVAFSSKDDTGLTCPGTGSYYYTAPWFTPAKGRGSTGGQSTSQICGSWVDEYHQLDSSFGYSQNITASSNLNHDVARFHWTLTYSVYLNTTWGGGNNTAYAAGLVDITAFVWDKTAGGSVGSSSSYYNFSYVLDRTGLIFFTVYQAHPVMLVHFDLISGHVYQFETYVTAETRAEARGPTSSTDTAYAQVVFPGRPAGGLLASITY